jgi:hypothetical protein
MFHFNFTGTETGSVFHSFPVFTEGRNNSACAGIPGFYGNKRYLFLTGIKNPALAGGTTKS